MSRKELPLQQHKKMKRALLLFSLATASCFTFLPNALPVSRIIPQHGLAAPVYKEPRIRFVELRPALRMSSSSQDAGGKATLPAEAQQLKAELIQSCENFKGAQLQMWQAEAEKVGEKEKKDRLGGILGAESLGVVMLEVGEIGNATLALAQRLSEYSPYKAPVLGWKGHGGSEPSQCKMDGKWKKIFTTAADATFKPSARRGNATITQEVDADAGVFTNIITFDGTRNKVREFRVKINGAPESDTDISLDFRRIILIRRSKIPFLFGKITIPLPRRSVINTIARWGSRGKAKAAPKALIEMQYLDDDLWIHKTGENNWFIQTRMDPEAVVDE